MKIDTTKIAGFDEMTAEDKLNALLGYEFDEPKEPEDVAKLKNALSKANSDAAEWKRQFREKQTEAERAEAERKEHEAAVEEELRTLRRDKTIGGYVAQCLALGYDKDLALRAAEAMADGDAAAVLSCQQDFIEAKKKELEATALNKQPGLTSGSTPTAKDADKDELNKLRRYAGLKPI